MTKDLASMLRRFSRQMALLGALRWTGAILVVGALLLISGTGGLSTGQFAAIAVGVPLLIVASAALSIALTRQVQAAAIMLSLGKLDDAEVWLKRGLTKFTLSRRAKITAAHLLATLLMQRGQYEDVVAVCRALLRQRLERLRQTWVDARLILADALLLLGRLREAYEALMPVYGLPLPLEAKLKLLPIQLRYELAAGHPASSVSALPEKVRIAELMDPANAALTHALLAEACRRENRPAERDFLAERARLYHDLEPLAQRHPIINPIASSTQTS